MPAPATTKPVPEAPVYRPVSALAIAGLTLGVLHALGVSLIGVSAWRHGTPLLIPWVLVLAVAGATLSGAAWLQITRSEGTRAGLGLARWGWWLSLLFGLGYATHIVFIELAVRADSKSFANAWFNHFRTGGIYTAFFYTVAPAQRQGDNPADVARLRLRYQVGARGQKGPLAVFLDHDLVRILQQAGPDAQVESQGVQNWEYVGGGYLAELNYRLTTPEGIYDVVLPTWTGESQGPKPEFEGRQSYVLINQQLSIRARGQTALGQRMQALRQSGSRFFDEWGTKLTQGRNDEAYLDTCDPAVRHRLRVEYAARLALIGLAGDPLLFWTASPALADTEWGRALCFPGYGDLVHKGLIRTDQLQSANLDEIRAEIKDLTTGAAHGRTSRLIRVPEGSLRFSCPWTIESGNIQLTMPVEVRLGSKYYLQGTAVLSLHHPSLVQEVARLQQNNPAAHGVADSPEPLPSGVVDSWRVQYIDLATGVDLSRGRGN
jgi:hypothetical protein